MLWLAVLLLAVCAVGNASGRGIISWTQATNVCSVSDAYYMTEDGRKAFVAGGLTAVPAGAEVYMTISPVAEEGAPMRLAADGHMDFGDGQTVPLECVELSSSDTGAGLYRFVMPEREGDSVAQLVLTSVRVYSISMEGTPVGGALSTADTAGEAAVCAAEGEPVIIQAQPDAQHVLSGATLSVTAADGEAVAVRRTSEGLEFSMPAGDVSIAAEFAEAAAIELTDGLECIAYGDAVAAAPLRAMPGSEVTLTVTPVGENMRISSGSVRVTADGAPVECVINETDGESGAFICAFTMPEGAVQLKANVGESYRARYEADIKLLRADGTAATAYCAGDELYVTVRVPDGMGLVDDRLTIACDSGYVLQKVVAREGGSITFMITAPADDMAVSADARALRRVTYTQPQGLGVIQTYPACQAAAGSRVTVALLPAQGWRVKDGSLRICSTGSHIETATVQAGSFIMPDSDCEISAVFEPELFEAKLDGGECFALHASYSMSALGAVEAPVESGVPCGALVSVRADATDGCRAQAIYMQPLAAESVQPVQVGQGGQAAFVMPAHAVVLFAACENAEHVHPLMAATGAAQSEDPAQTDDDGMPYAATVTADNLRLRAEPDTVSEVVGTYSTGERLTVNALSEDGEWVGVTIDGDGSTGWMKLEFVERAAAQLPEGETPALNITILIPAIEPQVVGAIEQREENSNGRYQFRHILFL